MGDGNYSNAYLQGNVNSLIPLTIYAVSTGAAALPTVGVVAQLMQSLAPA